MSGGLGPLTNGGHVVIIGGGPAGAGTALALHHLAHAMGRHLRITVVESKTFAGEQHYNQCAGVLSPPLPDLLAALEVPFPHHLARGRITGYVLHVPGRTLLLDGDAHPSIALRRVQFDAYLLEQVRQRGIGVHAARVTDLEFHADGVLVYTDNAPLEADVVVGAFGLDEGTATIFHRQTGYRPPRALTSVVTKYHPGPEGMAAFGSHLIHAFLPRHPRIEFGAVTPKGNHLTINIAGEQVNAALMNTFLHLPEVQAILPNFPDQAPHQPQDLRFFKGRFPRSLAHRYYGDRYVIVGDAAGLVRAFKGKGVTAAVQTGMRAAATILQQGISHAAFDRHYRQANQDIIHDLPYGQMVRLLAIHATRWGLMKPVLQAAENRPALQSALFGAVSGHDPYAQVLRRVLHPREMLPILQALLHIG